jgi:hypothetical protein
MKNRDGGIITGGNRIGETMVVFHWSAQMRICCICTKHAIIEQNSCFNGYGFSGRTPLSSAGIFDNLNLSVRTLATVSLPESFVSLTVDFPTRPTFIQAHMNLSD